MSDENNNSQTGDSASWMESLNTKLSDFWAQLHDKILLELPLLKCSFISVFIWGLLAHGYMFTSHALNHDSLTEFDAGIYGTTWKYQAGRIVVPLYRGIFRGPLTVPWMIGFLALVWCALTLWLLCKTYKITSKWQILLLGGCLTANMSFIAMSATYLHDLDQNMMSLLIAVLAVYVWKNKNNGWLIGMPLVAISLGLYQAFLTVVTTLLVFEVLLMLNKGYAWPLFFKRCLSALGMVAGGGIIYFILVKVIPYLNGVELSSDKYNSLGGQVRSVLDILNNLGKIYSTTFKNLIFSPTHYSRGVVACEKITLLVIAGIILFNCTRKNVGRLHRWLMALIIIFVLPVSLQIACLFAGFSHELMLYSSCLVYAAAIILIFNIKKYQTLVRTLAVVFFTAISWSNVQAANNLYVRKRIEADMVRSFMTRVLDKIEAHPEYQRGKTKVVFVGSAPEHFNPYAWGKYHELVGAWPDIQMTHTNEWYAVYFSYFMQNKITLVDNESFVKYNLDPEFEKLPPFPAPRSVAMHNDVMVVKIGKTPMSYMPIFARVLYRKVEDSYSGKLEQFKPLLSVLPDDPAPALNPDRRTEKEIQDQKLRKTTPSATSTQKH